MRIETNVFYRKSLLEDNHEKVMELVKNEKKRELERG